MKEQIENLGKVSVTIEEGYWDIKKSYDKLTIIEREGTGTTFISRKPVPPGISILNRKYWIKFSKWSDIPYKITQKFGDSEELAISQKTLTNKFSEVETEIQEGDEALNQRVRVVEVHERIMVDGGELEVATAEDLENPQTPRQDASVPTVRAILDASDDEPHLNSTKRFINSDSLAKMYGYYLDNPEFIYILTDNEYHIILGVKTDGDVVFGVTVPSQIKEYIDSRINEILGVGDVTEKIDTINEMIAFFDEISHDTTLKELLAVSAQAVAEEKKRAEAAEQHLDEVKANKEEVNAALGTKVDKEEGKSLIDSEFAEGVHYIESPEFAEVKLDAEGRIAEATYKDGTKLLPAGVKIGGAIESDCAVVTAINNPEFVAVWLDSSNRILLGIRNDADIFFGYGVPSQIKDYIDEEIGKFSPEGVQEIIDFIGEYLENTTLQELFDKKVDGEYVENPEYIDVKLDNEDKVLEGIREDGTKVLPAGIDTPKVNLEGATIKNKANPEYIEAKVDAEDRLLEGTKTDGTKVISGNLEVSNDLNVKGDVEVDGNVSYKNGIPQAIVDYVAANTGSGVSNIEYEDATGDMYATFDSADGVTDVYMEENGDIYAEIEE